MEFSLVGLTETNSSEAEDGGDGSWSLYRRKPAVTALSVGVLGVAAVVGTVGNLVVIATVYVKRFSRRGRSSAAETTGNDAGRALIANLALSDMIVTAVVNPLAIAGQCVDDYHSKLH